MPILAEPEATPTSRGHGPPFPGPRCSGWWRAASGLQRHFCLPRWCFLHCGMQQHLPRGLRGDSAGACGHQVTSDAGDGNTAEPGVGGDSRQEHGGHRLCADAFRETLELQGGGGDPARPRAAEAEAAVPRTTFD